MNFHQTWYGQFSSIFDRVIYLRQDNGPPIPISFQDDNLSKHQWIFTKLGMCIDIMEIWFGIANGQISSNDNLSNC